MTEQNSTIRSLTVFTPNPASDAASINKITRSK